jgi:peptide/nickel transport system permease protein
MIFTIRGMGELLITAIHDKDILVMQCAILVIGVSFAVINLLVDMVYLLIDPRIKL